MEQPVQPIAAMRLATIQCFTCDDSFTLELKEWELEKHINCPHCHGKEAIINSTF